MRDLNVPLDNKGKPWLDIVDVARVDIPQTEHFKPPGLRDINPLSVQQTIKKQEGILNAVCKKEKELPKPLARECRTWANNNLEIRPYSIDWLDVYFCNKFHFGIGPQITKRVKRPIDKK